MHQVCPPQIPAVQNDVLFQCFITAVVTMANTNPTDHAQGVYCLQTQKPETRGEKTPPLNVSLFGYLDEADADETSPQTECIPVERREKAGPRAGASHRQTHSHVHTYTHIHTL